jgi:hypothetical protein
MKGQCSHRLLHSSRLDVKRAGLKCPKLDFGFHQCPADTTIVEMVERAALSPTAMEKGRKNWEGKKPVAENSTVYVPDPGLSGGTASDLGELNPLRGLRIRSPARNDAWRINKTPSKCQLILLKTLDLDLRAPPASAFAKKSFSSMSQFVFFFRFT